MEREHSGAVVIPAVPALRLAGCKPLDGVCVGVKNPSYECVVAGGE
jgi:hypothetical protein